MTIYLDSYFKCHTTDDGTRREVQTAGQDGYDFFANKCPEFIEAYLYIPEGETWIREDGEKFVGEMFSPWNLTDEVLEVQSVYEQGLLAKYAYELKELDEQYVELMYEHTLLELGITESE